jgi:hypothetical protein
LALFTNDNSLRLSASAAPLDEAIFKILDIPPALLLIAQPALSPNGRFSLLEAGRGIPRGARSRAAADARGPRPPGPPRPLPNPSDFRLRLSARGSRSGGCRSHCRIVDCTIPRHSTRRSTAFQVLAGRSMRSTLSGRGEGAAVRVRLKGVHRPVRAKLPSGEVTEYFYGWRGGPRLVGQPGSPEFMASSTWRRSPRAASRMAARFIPSRRARIFLD